MTAASPPSSPGRSWAVVIPAMVLPLIASLFYFVWFSDHAFSRVLYGVTKLFTLVWPLLAVAWVLRERWPRLGLGDPRHWRAVPAGLVVGGAIVAIMFGLMETPMGEMVRGSAGDIRLKVEQLGVLEYYWWFGGFIAFLHSLLEEYYWRWFVFGRLARLVRPAWAHGLAGAAFAAHHIVIATQYFPLAWGWLFGSLIGLGGVVWSLMYVRQQSLAGAWVAHILADLGILTLGHKLLFGTYF